MWVYPRFTKLLFSEGCTYESIRSFACLRAERQQLGIRTEATKSKMVADMASAFCPQPSGAPGSAEREVFRTPVSLGTAQAQLLAFRLQPLVFIFQHLGPGMVLHWSSVNTLCIEWGL